MRTRSAHQLTPQPFLHLDDDISRQADRKNIQPERQRDKADIESQEKNEAKQGQRRKELIAALGGLADGKNPLFAVRHKAPLMINAQFRNDSQFGLIKKE